MSKIINYLPLGILTGATLLGGGVLASAGGYAEATCTNSAGVTTCTESRTASVTVAEACSFSTDADGDSVTDTREVNVEVDNGTYNVSSTIPTKVFCNKGNGFSVYAVGYTGDTETPVTTGDNTKLVGTSTGLKISTGTSGTDSYWAMKLAAVSGTYAPTVETGFDDWHEIPASRTPVVSLSGTTDTTTGSNFTTQYKIYASSNQAADTYTGKVRYTLSQS